MPQQLRITVSPSEAFDQEFLRRKICSELGIKEQELTDFHIDRRSIDARNKNIKINLTVTAFVNEEVPLKKIQQTIYKDVSSAAQTVIVVGAGPAGLFAALQLIKQGIKPVIIERGKDVRSRRRDIAALNKHHIVNPNSNYCFGEGGAGTYSDGKLYTRSTKRGDVTEILRIFVEHGASEDILIDAHPHIGTNKLPGIIVKIRESILKSGGEIHFNTLLTDIIINNGNAEGIVCTNLETGKANELNGMAVILATGHSARDIFELLHRKNILLEPKPFAMGVRVEHPQVFIDSMQYHCSIEQVPARRKYLPAAAYSWVEQVRNRGVYSFCMCPGGIIAPCATSQQEIVTNGWSPSKRNNPFANSGIVVGIEHEDLLNYKQYGPLAGLRFQQEVEHGAWIAGGKTQTAPAQRLTDFINSKISADLPPASYQPGIISAPIHQILPGNIALRLQEGFKLIGQKKKKYITSEAIIVAVESRTSSPVRIPRDSITLTHPQARNLYPCGEGGGYAGGIISAAIDGISVAKAIAQNKLEVRL